MFKNIIYTRNLKEFRDVSAELLARIRSSAYNCLVTEDCMTANVVSIFNMGSGKTQETGKADTKEIIIKLCNK